MKKIFLVLLLLLILSVNASAFNPMLVFSGVPSSGGGTPNACTGGETIGYTTNGASSSQLASARVQVIGGYNLVAAFQAPCTGNLDTGYVYHNTTNDQNCKVLVFNDGTTEGTIDANDSLVGTSGIINSSTDEELASAAMVSGSVIYGQWYWIAIAPDGAWDAKYTTDSDAIAQYPSSTCEGYDSQPDPLSSCSFNADNDRKFSAYVTLSAP